MPTVHTGESVLTKMAGRDGGPEIIDLEPQPPLDVVKAGEKIDPGLVAASQMSSFLAWTGLVTSVLGLVLTVDILLITYLTQGHLSSIEHISVLSITVMLATVLSALAVFSAKLRTVSAGQERIGLSNILRVGCYVKSALDILVCLTGIGYSVIEIVNFIPIFNFPRGLPALPIIIFAIYFGFVSLMIHGVKNSNVIYIKIYLIFKIVIYIVFVISCISFVSLYLKPDSLFCIGLSNVWIILTFYYIYSNGFVYVYYSLINHEIVNSTLS